MSSGLIEGIIIFAVIVCLIALLKHGGPTMAIPVSKELFPVQNCDGDSSKSSRVNSGQEHICLSSRVPCLNCELLTLLLHEILREHQPIYDNDLTNENLGSSDDLNEASAFLEYADDEDSVPNHVPGLGNEDNNNLLQGNLLGIQDNLQDDIQVPDDLNLNDQVVPFAGRSESITMDNEEEFYQD